MEEFHSLLTIIAIVYDKEKLDRLVVERLMRSKDLKAKWRSDILQQQVVRKYYILIKRKRLIKAGKLLKTIKGQQPSKRLKIKTKYR